MRKVLRVIVAILMLSTMMAIHEFGHAQKMLQYGIAIDEFGIGYPIDGVPSWTFEIVDVPVTVHPLLVAAYVRMSESAGPALNALSYGEFAEVVGTGVLYNLLTGLILLASYCWMQGYKLSFPRRDKRDLAVPIMFVPIAIAVILYFGQYWFTFVFAYLGIASLALISVGIYSSRRKAMLSSDSKGLIDAVMPSEREGLVSAVSGISRHIGSGKLSNLLKELSMWAFGLALLNMIPAYPFDGGWQITWLLEKVVSETVIDVYQWAGWIFFLTLVACTFASDIRLVINRLLNRRKFA